MRDTPWYKRLNPVRMTVILIALLIAFAAISVTMRPRPELYSAAGPGPGYTLLKPYDLEELEVQLIIPPEAALVAALAEGDGRFLAVGTEGGYVPPGAEIDYTPYGIRIFDPTTDVIMSAREALWKQAAHNYAATYNQLLSRELRKIHNDCVVE